jgi:hypothetical protein
MGLNLVKMQCLLNAYWEGTLANACGNLATTGYPMELMVMWMGILLFACWCSCRVGGKVVLMEGDEVD